MGSSGIASTFLPVPLLSFSSYFTHPRLLDILIRTVLPLRSSHVYPTLLQARSFPPFEKSRLSLATSSSSAPTSTMKVIVFLYAMVGMLSAIAAEAHVQRRSPSTTVDAQSIYKQRLAARQYKHRPHKLVTRQDGSCPAPIPVPSARTPSCGTSGCSFCSECGWLH